MQQKFWQRGDRALLTVSAGTTQFHLYIPSGGNPMSVAAVLGVVAPLFLGRGVAKDAGSIMACIISAIDPKVRVRLTTTASLGHEKKNADIYYECNFGIVGVSVQASHIHDGRQEAAIFDGALSRFMEWTKNMTGLEGLKNKVVQFKYKGGSTPGGLRTVRVDEVKKENGDMVCIAGYDLTHAELKKGYRTYHADRIDGEIAVLN